MTQPTEGNCDILFKSAALLIV